MQLVRLACSLALARAGNSIAARIAMMAMTTSSSIKVKPRRRRKGLEAGFRSPANPENPERMNIAFRAGTGGLHSAENWKL